MYKLLKEVDSTHYTSFYTDHTKAYQAFEEAKKRYKGASYLASVELFMDKAAVPIKAYRNDPAIIQANPSREAELARLLQLAACPANCDDGTLTDNYGTPEQCQFCYERGELL